MRFTIFCALFFLFVSCSSKEELVVREALVYLTIHQDNFDLYQGDVLGKWERRLTYNIGRDWSPKWNAGLQRLVYYAEDTTDLVSVISMDLASKDAIPLLKVGLANAGISPDGKGVYYTKKDGESQHIWRCNLNGENHIQLTKGESLNHDFSVSPTGTHLSFVSNRSGAEELYLLDLMTREVVQLTDNEMIEEYSTWSPAGDQIAFTMRSAEKDSKEDIFIMNLDGSGLYQLTSTPYAERELAWSLSGKKIAFHGSTENDGDQIYTIDLADGKFTKITSGTDYRGEPTWIPIKN